MGGDVEGGSGAFDDREVAVDVSYWEIEAHWVVIGLNHAAYHSVHSVAVGIGFAIVGELPHNEPFKSL